MAMVVSRRQEEFFGKTVTWAGIALFLCFEVWVNGFFASLFLPHFLPHFLPRKWTLLVEQGFLALACINSAYCFLVFMAELWAHWSKTQTIPFKALAPASSPLLNSTLNSERASMREKNNSMNAACSFLENFFQFSPDSSRRTGEISQSKWGYTL